VERSIIYNLWTPSGCVGPRIAIFHPLGSAKSNWRSSQSACFVSFGGGYTEAAKIDLTDTHMADVDVLNSFAPCIHIK